MQAARTWKGEGLVQPGVPFEYSAPLNLSSHIQVLRMASRGNDGPLSSTSNGLSDLDSGVRQRSTRAVDPSFHLQRVARPRRRHVADVDVDANTRLIQPCRSDGHAASPIHERSRDSAVQDLLGVDVHVGQRQMRHDSALGGGGYELNAAEEDAIDGRVGTYAVPVLLHVG